jgi:DHA1 family bicyclomycin/chloramphenicol resistance-like MFS transporter
VFTLASAGCALSTTIEQLVLFRTLQGMCAGSGMVVSRAIIRDLFPPSDAQRVMSQVTIFFGVAPAIAPLIGGWLYVHSDWHWIFWFLTAVGLLLTLLNWRALPESLPQAQPFAIRPLMQGYFSMLRSRASGCWCWPAASRSTACSCTCWRRRSFSVSTWGWRPRSSSGSS